MHEQKWFDFLCTNNSGQRKQIVNKNDMKFDSLKSWRLKYFHKNQNCTTREIYLLSSQYLTLFM